MAGAIRRVLRRGEDGRQAGDNPSRALLELARRGPTALSESIPDADRVLRIATLIPSFRRGSGGHATIVRLLRELHGRGHEVSVWLEDGEGRHARESPELTRSSFREFFSAEGIELHTDASAWDGADVVLATGWQTVASTMLLPGAGVRAYLVQDHEPDFYAASSEARWAAQTYRLGLHCIAASPWLARLLRERYAAAASHFDLGVDHEAYRPPANRGETDGERVVFYARASTPRRAVPAGLLALGELARRRPGVEISLYGESAVSSAPFPHRNLGVLTSGELAGLYGSATVGMVLSLTNPSLINLEMMACGLPCVELASESMQATFGGAGPLDLAEPEPLALCAALERLLDDPARRASIAAAGIELAAGRTWTGAAVQVEQGLRAAISLRGADDGPR
jgi:glycosyltransferase involved in cell wall biosynthesis